MINKEENEKQIKDIKRVREHGEVLTARREVDAMLDLVKNETERIDSRFLEPACGDGNFLVAILERKLAIVLSRYKNKKVDFEIQMLNALSSIYGIDLLKDNIEIAINRMEKIAIDFYKNVLKTFPDENYIKTIRFILEKNILQGDSLNGIDKIIFTQWSLIGYHFKREEYSFAQINQKAEILNTPLFASLVSDKGDDVFIPQPLKSYPLAHYRNLS